MTSKKTDQTPIVPTDVGIPQPAETSAPAESPTTLDDLTDAEREFIMAFRNKPTKETVPDDYEFPHTENYAHTLTMIYDPYSENFDIWYPTAMYRNEQKVSQAVAEAAVKAIYAHETRAPEGQEIKLIRAYRHGNIDFARSILAERSEDIEFEEDDPDSTALDIGEQIAFTVVGQLAMAGNMERIYLQDSDLLTSFIMDIAAGINHALPQVDHVAIDRQIAQHKRKAR